MSEVPLLPRVAARLNFCTLRGGPLQSLLFMDPTANETRPRPFDRGMFGPCFAGGEKQFSRAHPMHKFEQKSITFKGLRVTKVTEKSAKDRNFGTLEIKISEVGSSELGVWYQMAFDLRPSELSPSRNFHETHFAKPGMISHATVCSCKTSEACGCARQDRRIH